MNNPTGSQVLRRFQNMQFDLPGLPGIVSCVLERVCTIWEGACGTEPTFELPINFWPGLPKLRSGSVGGGERGLRFWKFEFMSTIHHAPTTRVLNCTKRFACDACCPVQHWMDWSGLYYHLLPCSTNMAGNSTLKVESLKLSMKTMGTWKTLCVCRRTGVKISAACCNVVQCELKWLNVRVWDSAICNKHLWGSNIVLFGTLFCGGTVGISDQISGGFSGNAVLGKSFFFARAFRGREYAHILSFLVQRAPKARLLRDWPRHAVRVSTILIAL